MSYHSPMNKTLAITTIVLVAIVMGMSAVAPMIPQAFAHDVPEDTFEEAHKICKLIIPRDFPIAIIKLICDH